MAAPDSHSDLLAPFRDNPSDAAVLCDFDGTLATIVPTPDRARAVPGVVAALHELASIYGMVAVVSGRPASFLVEHLELTPTSAVQAVGAYGLEWVTQGSVVYHPDVQSWCGAVATVVEAANEQAPEGVLVEDKTVSLTIHVRTAPEHQAWARSFAEGEAASTGLSLHEARMSYELRPPLPIDKGTAVASLISSLGPACFFGDDRGDLSAFDALDRHRAEVGAPVVKAAVRSEEAPPELLARADLLVDGPTGVVEVLRALAG